MYAQTKDFLICIVVQQKSFNFFAETRLKLELKTIADEGEKFDDEEEAESEIQLEFMNPTHGR